MTTTSSEVWDFKQNLEQKQAQLLQILRRRDNVSEETSAQQMDEVRNEVGREVAIRNLGRESSLLRAVRIALRRLQGGSFGACGQCQAVISPRRLAAVPWALLCIPCLESADRDRLTTDAA